MAFTMREVEMAPGSLTIGGKRFVVLPEREYERLTGISVAEPISPPWPKPDAEGNVPAIAYARISLARKLIAARKRAGWSQAELARQGGVRTETVNRIELGKNTPDEKTFAKLGKALKRVGVSL
jgi:DNA-binding XRE family transcriptional regulator